MKAGLCRIILAVILLGLIQPVFAGEILLSAENPQTYSPQDEETIIRLDMKNTFGEDVLGSFSWTVRDQDDLKNAQSFTDSRAMFSDQNYTEFGVRPEGGKKYLVDVTFDYFDDADPDMVYHVALEGIQLRPDDETTAPGTILESVQTKMTKGSSQDQSGTLQQGGSGSTDQALLSQVRSGRDDTESLSQILEKEAADLSERKTLLQNRVETSELYTSIDELLEGAGFVRQDLGVTLGQGSCNDEFETSFVNENNSVAHVSGDVKGDEILFLNAEVPGEVLPVYGIEENETYLSLDAELRNDNFTVSKSILNRTPEGAALNIVYEKESLQKTITITVRDGKPVSVVLEDPDDGIHYLFPAMVLVITALSAFLLYRCYVRYCTTWEKEAEGTGIGAENVSNPPLELLEKSYDDYLNGELKEAFSTAGQAVRLQISLRYAGGENRTNLQALTLLGSVQDPDYDRYAGILSVCDAVVYGCREPAKELFVEHYRQIRSLLTKDRT